MHQDSLFIFAGETSADLFGAKLLLHLKEKKPSLHYWGVAGPALRELGLDPFMRMETFQVMGLSDVLAALPRLMRAFFTLRNQILAKNPKLCLLIDQPSFGIKLAKSLRKSGYKGKIVQYVAPTVWAYNAKRADILAQYFDALLTLFDFEPACFPSLKTVFVGHPILELMQETSDNLPSDRPILALFPGSRPGEIKRNLEKQLEAARLYCMQFPEYQIAVSVKEKIPTLDRNILQVPFHDRYELMRKSHLALAKSGTVTLELALHGVPTVVGYELSMLNYLMAKYFMKLKLPYFCIVNILANKELFFERIRPPVTAQDIADCLIRYQRDPALYMQCRDECLELRNRLISDAPPSQKAAEVICELL